MSSSKSLSHRREVPKLIKTKFITFTLIQKRRSYSTLSSLPGESIPIIIFNRLDNNKAVLSYRDMLKDKSGIYCFINIVNNKLYIGSAKYLYIRFIQHLSNKKSNVALQNAIQ